MSRQIRRITRAAVAVGIGAPIAITSTLFAAPALASRSAPPRTQRVAIAPHGAPGSNGMAFGKGGAPHAPVTTPTTSAPRAPVTTPTTGVPVPGSDDQDGNTLKILVTGDPFAPATMSFAFEGSSGLQGNDFSYTWFFGDNSRPGSGRTVSHRYAYVGAYSVTLQVMDRGGDAVTATREVVIRAHPWNGPTYVDVASKSIYGSIQEDGRTTASATFLVKSAPWGEPSRPVVGVKVRGFWTAGLRFVAPATGVTDENGYVTFTQNDMVARQGTAIRFCVRGLSGQDIEWNATLFDTLQRNDCVLWRAPTTRVS